MKNTQNNVKLTASDVIAIYKLKDQDSSYTSNEIIRALGLKVSKRTVQDVLNGNTWSHLTNKLKAPLINDAINMSFNVFKPFYMNTGILKALSGETRFNIVKSLISNNAKYSRIVDVLSGHTNMRRKALITYTPEANYYNCKELKKVFILKNGEDALNQISEIKKQNKL